MNEKEKSIHKTPSPRIIPYNANDMVYRTPFIVLYVYAFSEYSSREKLEVEKT
jgi:hypothetical protein